MNNSEWLMKLASEAPDELAEWFDAEHEEPCTSDGEKVQGLPDENVSYLLRDVAKKSDGHTLYHGMTKLMQAIGKEPEDRRETGSELAVALNTLADMVERDYVKREFYVNIGGAFERMKAERDDAHEQWEHWSKLATDIIALFYPVEEEGLPNDAYSVVKDSASKLKAERDEWKAKAEGSSKVRVGQSNLEWLYGYDESFAYGAKRFVVDDGYSCCETLDQAHEWLMAPHDDAHSKAHSKTEPNLTEQPELLSDEADSREKLEADVRKYLDLPANCRGWGDYKAVCAWLDRQAAITEAEMQREIWALESAGEAKDMQSARLEAERDYWREQVLNCVVRATAPGGFTGGVMRYPRDDGYTEPSLLVIDALDSLRDFHAELKAENEKLKAEVIQYAKDCGDCGTAMPKGVSWPRWSDGSLVELPCKMGYMGKTERLQGIRFYDNCFVLEFTGVDHCKVSYGLPYGQTFTRDDEGDEGLA